MPGNDGPEARQPVLDYQPGSQGLAEGEDSGLKGALSCLGMAALVGLAWLVVAALIASLILWGTGSPGVPI